MDKKPFKNILNNIITFFIILLIVNFIFNQFFSNKGEVVKTGVQISLNKQKFNQNDVVIANIENNTGEEIVIKSLCPSPDIQVETLVNNKWENKNYQTALDCQNIQDIIIPNSEKYAYSFKQWNHELFGNLGTYKLKLNINGEPLETPPFQVVNMSFFKWIYTVLIYQPIFNILALLVHIMPNNDLGWAIILLTIFIRTILLIPNHKVLKAQKKLQHVQPKINALKEKYGTDQQKIAQETFAIYKEHKVNPFSSCFPVLLQLPILIGLYNVIQSGMDSSSHYLLYSFFSNFNLSNTQNIWIGFFDLTKKDIFILPVLVGIMQYIQLKITFNKNKKTSDKKSSEMEIANKTMTYMMPAMMVFFTASVPSGVALYWTFSTLYGLIQQLVVNKSFQKEEITIEVLNENRNKSKKEHYKQVNDQRKKQKETIEGNENSDQENNDDSNITIIKA